jgi:tetratricopeptide (TPR) repeat protein
VPTDPTPTTDSTPAQELATGEYSVAPAEPAPDPAFAGTTDFSPAPADPPPGLDSSGLATSRSNSAPSPRPPIDGTIDHPSQGAGVGGGTSDFEVSVPTDGRSAASGGSAATADLSPTGAPAGESPPEPPTSPLGGPRYNLKKMHARGGMGEVWLAQDSGIGRTVALKKMRARMKGKEDQFFWEGQVTGQLEHPGVVPVHELGVDDAGEPYYVMKFVHGRTLLEEIEAFHGAPAGRPNREVERLRLLQVFLAMCETVAYAHSRGIIHRDIKPENVMIGGYGETLMLDWGLAKMVGKDEHAERGPLRRQSFSGETFETLAGSVKGTPWYMAPEVAAGATDTVDHLSDVFLLGATLYHLLTGKLPREGKTIPELITAAHKPPIPPRRHDQTIPKPLEGICLKAMAVAREDRYQTAKGLAEDLQRYLAGEPVTAYRETFAERAWRWARRHRRALSRTAAALAVLAVVGFTFAKYREFEQRRQAERNEAARVLQEEKDRAQAKAEADAAALRRSEEERAAEAAKAALLARQKQAAADLKRFRALAEEARFLAASTHPATATAPFFNPRAGLAKGEEALALAAQWGPKLGEFPLDAERPALANDLYDLLLLMAQLWAQGGGPNAGNEVLALLGRAEGLRPPTRSEYRLRAEALASTGKPAEAAAEAKKAADPATPLTAADHFLLGELARVPATRPDTLHDRTGKFLPNQAALEKAIAEYRLALRADPSHYWSHFQLGRCLLSLGQWAEGAQVLGTCVALRPDSPWAYSARAVALTTLKRYDEAAADLERAIQLDPAGRQHLLNRGVLRWVRKDTDGALADFDAVLAPPAEKQLPEAAFYKATMFGQFGRIDDALAAADRALAGKNPVAPAYLLRAQIHLRQGRDQEGIDDLNSFFAASDPTFDPKSPNAAARRARRLRLIAEGLPEGTTDAQRTGLVRAQGRMYRLAAIELESAIQRDGGTVDALEGLGRVQQRLGRTTDAIKAYSKALEKLPAGAEHVPDRARLLVSRGWAILDLQPPELPAAGTDFEAALKLAPDHAEAHTGLGYVEALRGAGPAARREAQMAVLYGAGDFLILHNVACVFAKLSEAKGAPTKEYEDLAIGYLRRAVELWKRDRSGPNELALIRGESAFGPALRARPEFKQLLLD